MESNKSTDFKSNVVNLTKIPPNEFEKCFQDWMERDDVARSLQAKLRCDLIKNFNKTNLGKHILSHTMTSSGGSTMRLTLSPLILALNTLVAEFLYAQNCHFTLSVFCTEIPYRNTLPDFESMRRFRFNHEEIFEIWQAVTGSQANKTDLKKSIIHNYETNTNTSLLLLIIKSLLQKHPLEPLKRNAEVQTDIKEKSHKSTSAQETCLEKKTSKATAKDDNLDHINKYLLTLSEKVIEMTKEFEQFTKQKHESRSRHTLSSRQYYTLNKSLERITENMKAAAQTKRKNKRLSNIVESIDNLTQQFGKCAQNFDNVTKFLNGKKTKPVKEKLGRTKVKLKEKQTETEAEEKSYNDWIYEMRHTENGKRFLNKVELSLRKALNKYLDQLQSETDIKLKHLKSLMRLHYEQKLTKHLLQDPKTNLEERRRCKDNIEKKLQQFERKQMELVQKLHESSLELKEAQLRQKPKSPTLVKGEFHRKQDDRSLEQILTPAGIENHSTKDFKSADAQEPQNINIENMDVSQFDENIQQEKSSQTLLTTDIITKEKATQISSDISTTQEQILDLAHNIAEQGHSVDHIIFDAKLRIQQLENESNQLEQNFQSYLERRKRSQQEYNSKENITSIYPILKDLCQITSARFRQERAKPTILQNAQDDEEFDKELRCLQELQQMQMHEPTNDIQKTAKSESSTSSLEIKNAILEAKLKFFEHENTMRKCREQEEEIRNGNLLQKQLEMYTELQELPEYFNQNFDHYSKSEAEIVDKNTLEFNLESSLSEINIKDKTLDEEHDIDLGPMTEQKSQKTPTSIRRELFPKLNKKNITETTSSHQDLQNYSKYPESTSKRNGAKAKEITKSTMKKNGITAKLIKQSMAKMQQLFEQQAKSQETLRDMVNELQQEKVLQKEEATTRLPLRSNDIWEKSFNTTTVTSTTTPTRTMNVTKTSEESEMKNASILKRISTTSMPSLLNLSSESEDDMDSKHPEILTTTDALKKIDEEQSVTKEPKEIYEISDSSISSELHTPRPLNKNHQKLEANAQQEFGQINDSPEVPDLNLYSPSNDKEIGEVFTETNRTFAPIDVEFGESFSSQSSSDLEISTGHQNKDAKNLADDSESDFWA